MKMKKIDIREIDGFRLGNAENAEAGTGVTVIVSEVGAVAGVDVRGGGPATRETDLLRSENTVDKINAVVLSGGSAFGLEAASGVMRALAARGVGFRIDENIVVPIVPGASLYDLAIGRSDVFPDVEMGREAVQNAFDGIFDSGNHGAGTGASVGKYLGNARAMKTGLGTFACGDDVVKVGAVAAVNAVGDVYNGAGNIIAGLRTADGTEIKGTIRVLKGMVHDGSDPDLNLSDIRTMAAAEIIRNSPADKPDQKQEAGQEQETAGDERSEILKAMMQSYEEEQAKQDQPEPEPEAAAEEPAPEIIPEIIPEISIEDEYLSMDAEITEAAAAADNAAEGSASQDDTPAEVCETAYENTYEVPETAGEPEVTVSKPEAAEAQETVQEPEHETAPQTAAEDDMFVLTEEDKADMGYDIPFNTTISCLITNAKLTKSQANKLASILHDAYARAIKPVHGTLDGDTVFVMSTDEVPVNFDAFAALATDVMQYAIIDGASSAAGAYGLPAARDIIHK